MKKNIHNAKVIISMFIFVLLFGLNLGVVRAVDSSGSPSTPASGGSPTQVPVVRLKNPIAANNIQDLMLKIADIAIFIGTMFAVLMFFWVGFKFVMARGNEKEVTDAKKMLMNVAIGTVILISSKVIVVTIKNTLISSGVVDKQIFELPKNNP